MPRKIVTLYLIYRPLSNDYKVKRVRETVEYRPQQILTFKEVQKLASDNKFAIYAE